MIFLTIGDLVSPSSSLYGNPLPVFPIIGNLVSIALRPLRTSAGAERSALYELKICPLSAARKSRAVKPWDLSCRCCHSRHRMFTPTRGASINYVTGLLCGPRFRGSRDWFVTQLFFGSNPVLDILSLFAAALQIQLIRSVSDLFFRWFSACKHSSLLGCHCKGRTPDCRR